MTDPPEETNPEDIHQLLNHFAKAPFRAKETDRKTDAILQKCLDLFKKDYKFSVINNLNGELCGTYPNKLVLLEYQREGRASSDEVESLFDLNRLREIFKQARKARCRARCVIPVILFEGKHICRSATLSGGAEIYGRSGFDFLFSGPGASNAEEGTSQDIQSEFDKVRGQDIHLLKSFNVGYIYDLMVEKKKVKFGMNVTSSEKVDKEQRYNEFSIFSVPYPGCEFFREWKDSGYESKRMLFDWNQGYVDACLEVPPIPILQKLGLDWTKYKQWDLLTLTQNYIKLLLQLVREGDSGVLVHCISGWDRTPMFISLLRLSLWADGLIHQSLCATEVLYLTIAYDWYLFGHNLSDRLTKGEEILYFCFHFMKCITSEEFSLRKTTNGRNMDGTSSRTEADSTIDGMLLDTDNNQPNYTGSNSSVNSGSSSSMDNSVSSPANNADTLQPNGSTTSSVTINTKTSHHGDTSVHFSPASAGSSSSPVPVPINRVRYSEAINAQSPVSGSWQIISGSEGVGSFSSLQNSSPNSRLSMSSSSGSYNSTGRSSHTSSCSEVTEQKVSIRWQRLNTVWRVFHNAYANTISVRYGTEPRGLGMLLDRFAETVGIRPMKNAPV